MYLVGIVKLDETYGGSGFVSGIFWDLVVLLSLAFHRYQLNRKGLWRSDLHLLVEGRGGVEAEEEEEEEEYDEADRPKSVLPVAVKARRQASDGHEDEPAQSWWGRTKQVCRLPG